MRSCQKLDPPIRKQEQSTTQESTSDSDNEDESKLSRMDAIAKALSLASMGNHQGALELMEELSAQYPTDIGIKTRLLQRLNYRSNQLVVGGNKEDGYELYKRAAIIAREVILSFSQDKQTGLRKRNARLIYNEACAYALEGDAEKCLASLQEAMDWGFENLDHMLNDNDLNIVADSDEFTMMLGDDFEKYNTNLRQAVADRLKQFTPVDFDISMPDLEGRIINVSDFQNQTLILAFWSTENGISRQNLVTLDRLRKNFPESELKIITVACERTKEIEDAAELVRAFQAENEFPFDCLLASPIIRHEMKRKQGFPTTMLIDKKGKVRFAFPGRQRYFVLATFVQQIMNLPEEQTENEVEVDADGQARSQGDGPPSDDQSK